MTNEEFLKISQILESVSRPSRLPIVLLGVSQVLLTAAFLLHSVGGLF